MSEAEPPPPYSLAEEQESNPTPTLTPQPQPQPRPQPSLRLKPSASPLNLRPGPDPPLRPSPGSSSNVPLPSAGPASDGSSSTVPLSYLDSAMFSPVTKKVKRPLVTIEDIRTHLRLLRAFKLFQEKVEDPYSDPEVADAVPPIGKSIGVKGRWLWFLEMGVERSVFFLFWFGSGICWMLIWWVVNDYRFRRWLLLLATAEGFFVIPPVDVWLIWHVYMLNPMSVLVPLPKGLMSNLEAVGMKVVYRRSRAVVVFTTIKESRGKSNGFGSECNAFLWVAAHLTGRL